MNGFYNPYMMQGNYITELQNMRDRIDSQIQQVQQQQQSMQPPTNLTQNFQLAPNSVNNIKLANSIEEVQKEIIVADTYFFNKEMTNLWIKNPKGDIRSFNIKEIVPKDEKDLIIESLQKKIEQLERGNVNASTNEYNEPNGELLYQQSSTNFGKSIGDEIKTNKSEDVPSISTSKATKRKS